MNECCECCFGETCCSCFDFNWTNKICPRPFSMFTVIYVLVNLTFMGLTIAFLISESSSSDFKTNCSQRMIIHPIVMICITAVNVCVSIAVYCYYNRDISDPKVKQSNKYYLQKTSQMLCYRIPFCLYYIFVIGFMVFIILGQLLIFNETQKCLDSFQKTRAFDYVLMSIFLLMITFGIIFVCCAINVNSEEGSDWVYLFKFFLNIMTCGECFKKEFNKDTKTNKKNKKNQVEIEQIMHRDDRGKLPESHYYTNDRVEIHKTEENNGKKAGFIDKMADIMRDS